MRKLPPTGLACPTIGCQAAIRSRPSLLGFNLYFQTFRSLAIQRVRGLTCWMVGRSLCDMVSTRACVRCSVCVPPHSSLSGGGSKKDWSQKGTIGSPSWQRTSNSVSMFWDICECWVLSTGWLGPAPSPFISSTLFLFMQCTYVMPSSCTNRFYLPFHPSTETAKPASRPTLHKDFKLRHGDTGPTTLTSGVTAIYGTFRQNQCQGHCASPKRPKRWAFVLGI